MKNTDTVVEFITLERAIQACIVINSVVMFDLTRAEIRANPLLEVVAELTADMLRQMGFITEGQ